MAAKRLAVRPGLCYRYFRKMWQVAVGVELLELALLKILISVATVVGLAEIAKRVDPVLSGVLLGLPLGAGLTVYFVSHEQGIDFLLPGLPWAIAGLASALVFCLAYLLAGRFFAKGRLGPVLGCSLVALLAFFLSGLAVRSQEWTVVGATVMFLAVAAANLFLLKLIPGSSVTLAKNPTGFRALVLRGLIAGLIITVVTLIAPRAGAYWTGILSSFPSTLYALLVIVHFETGNQIYPQIIRSFARSVPALAVFYIGCIALLPQLGLNRGFFVVYVISAGYVYLTHRLLQRSPGRRIR